MQETKALISAMTGSLGVVLERRPQGAVSHKQKTAYEINAGDWSSDVCSSDLWVD